MNFILFLIKKIHFSSKYAGWHLKLEKEFPDNSPLQLTLIRTQFSHPPWLRVWLWHHWWVKDGGYRHSSSWLSHGIAQGSRSGRDMLAQSSHEICFHFQLIRHSRVNRTFWSLKQGRQVLETILTFSGNSFRWHMAIVKVGFNVKCLWSCRSVIVISMGDKFF